MGLLDKKTSWEKKRKPVRTLKTLRLSFLLLLCSCNQDQFYEKQYLDAAGKKGNVLATIPSTSSTISSDNNNSSSPNATAPAATPVVVVTTTNGNGSNSNPALNTDPVPPLADPKPDPVVAPVIDPVIVVDPKIDPVPVDDPKTDPAPLCNGGLGYKEANDKFVQNSGQEGKVDIVWVIDNSGSMGDEQDALAKNFDAFIGEFIAKKVDFKMAIITTDATSKKDGKIIGKSDQLLTSVKALENEAKFMADFKKLVNVGVNGSGEEKGLKTTETFLKDNGAKFLRPDAFLVVVVLSDEEEQSTKAVDDYVKYYKSFKTNPGMVKVHSIVTTEKTSFKWENIGTRYIEASQKTGGTITHIKQDFYTTLRDIGGKIVDLLDSFALSGIPVNSKFKVFVNDVEKTSGWSYDEIARSIKFESGHIPDEGSIVIVYYNVACGQ